MSINIFSAWRRLVSIFLAGLIAVLPLVLTVAIVVWVTDFVVRYVGPGTLIGRGLELLGLRVAANQFFAYAVGWLLVLAAVFAIGVVVQTGAKRFLQRMTEVLLRRIPIIGSIYTTSRQVVDMFDHQSETEMKAMSVVFCTFGGPGGPGVLALMPSPERFTIDGAIYHVVIVPTSPVPLGGGLIFMPVDQVKPAQMSVDGLMSIYVSMGVSTPQYMTKKQVSQ